MADAGDVARMRKIGLLLDRDAGVQVRWMPGWESRGGDWPIVPVGVTDHHDASTIKSGEWGSLGYILANNLSQFQVARCLDGVPKLSINAAGVCWHAGVGAWTFPDGERVAVNNGNYELYGAEKAHSGSASEPITEAAHYAADALYWAIGEECGHRPGERVVMHKEYGNTPPGGWPGRKTDPIYPGDYRRRRVAAFKPRNVTGGFLMALTDPQQEEILQYVREHRIGIAGERPAGPAALLHHRVDQRLARVEVLARAAATNAGVNVSELAEELRPMLAEAFAAGQAADNEAQADAIVDELVERLRTGPAPTP